MTQYLRIPGAIVFGTRSHRVLNRANTSLPRWVKLQIKHSQQPDDVHAEVCGHMRRRRFWCEATCRC
jgi:hypothetical protein